MQLERFSSVIASRAAIVDAVALVTTQYGHGTSKTHDVLCNLACLRTFGDGHFRLRVEAAHPGNTTSKHSRKHIRKHLQKNFQEHTSRLLGTTTGKHFQ